MCFKNTLMNFSNVLLSTCNVHLNTTYIYPFYIGTIWTVYTQNEYLKCSFYEES